MTAARVSTDSERECPHGCYVGHPPCPTCPLADAHGRVNPFVLLTDSQCARLGIAPADAADAAEWARTYGPLTDDQRDKLKAAVYPFTNGG